jgi:hypothetical protein
MRLRYRGPCVGCGRTLEAGEHARWDPDARTITCDRCAAEPGDEAPPAIDRGAAGASSRRRYERLSERREQRIRERHKRLGGLIVAMTSDPQSTTAWASGSEGERRVGALLDTVDDGIAITLHDRRIPGSRANIDHVAIARSGIYVIDTKRYSGRVERRDRGGWFSRDERLYVGRRDCSKLVAAMARQVDATRAAIQPLLEEFALPITPVLCFAGAEWSLFARPFRLDGVWIEWPKSLIERVQAPGPLSAPNLRLLARRVASRLPAA